TPPDDQNAAVRIREIRRHLQQTWPNWSAAIRDEDLPALLPSGAAAGTPPRAAAVQALERACYGRGSPHRLRPQQAAAPRAVVAQGAAALALTDGLETLSGGLPPTDDTSPLVIRKSDKFYDFLVVSRCLELS